MLIYSPYFLDLRSCVVASVLQTRRAIMERLQSENMTIGEAVSCFAIGRTKLYELIQKGDIEAFKLGRRTLVRTESVRAFIDSLPRVSGVA